jgi:hypothetical protein
MSEIVGRLKVFIDFKQISISAFEKSVGLANAAFGKTLKSGGAIGTDKLEKILQCYPDLNIDWLVTGQGEMLKSSTGDQVNGTVHGIAINRGSAEVRVSDALWTKEQIDELLSQNKQLLRIIENLTQK